MQLPRRQVLRDTCLHTYRVWNGTAFDYSRATCPYTGSATFAADDTVSDNAHDRCSRLVSGCKERFGETAVLPTRAFPGVARYRQ
jgi:lambda family phage minor tail protein L